MSRADRVRVVALLCVAACASPSELTAPLAVNGGCWDPASYGAAPDDGVDDRAGIQAAVDAAGAAGGGEVCLGRGVWDLSRAPVGSYDRFAAVSVHWDHVHLRGASERSTVLRVAGDQGAGTLGVLVLEHAADVGVSDLTVDTSGAYNTEEQFHTIRLMGPVAGVEIARVRFVHPRVGADRKGDCVQLVGSGADLVRDVRLVGLNLESCARTGVMLQRGVVGLQLTASSFGDCVKGAVHSEPTSYGQLADIQITSNAFLGTPTGYAVTLGGWDSPMAGVQVVGNTMTSGGIWMYRVSNAVIAANVITAPYARLIAAANTADRVLVSSNMVHVLAGATPNDYAMSFANHGSESPGAPSRLMVTANMVTSDVPGGLLALSAASGVTVASNDLAVTVPAPSSFGVFATPGTRDVDGLMISNNRVEALALRAAVLLSYTGASYPYHFGRVSVVGNMSTGTAVGLQLAPPLSTYAGPVVSSGNSWAGVPVAGPLIPQMGN